jgi:hypothetical protein
MRIKVTGYMDTDDFDVPEDHDPSSETGLSEEAYLAYMTGGRLLALDDLEFQVVEDEEDRGIDRAAEADYRAHSPSITGVYESQE